MNIPPFSKHLEDFQKRIQHHLPEQVERVVIIEKFEIDSARLLFDFSTTPVGIKFFDNNGRLHRNNNNPAVLEMGLFIWYKHGNIHRQNNRPAIISNTPNEEIAEEYWVNGNKHREYDLPAVVYKKSRNHAVWYKHGMITRENKKPALINGDFLFFYKEGVLMKTKIDYNNKFFNYVLNNDFLVSGIIFVISSIITFTFLIS